jgi:hypothetical protein
MTTLAWSKNGLYLAVGTAKGNLLMYNRLALTLILLLILLLLAGVRPRVFN